MRKSTHLILSALFIAVLSPIMDREAAAVADGNGSCSSAEDAASDCGQFGTGNAIEFLGAVSASCPFPCTQYNYKYTGNSKNQIELLIPNAVLTKFAPGYGVAGCSQLLAPGVGNPATAFGVNILTHSMCKLGADLPTGTQFSIQADPSTANPLSWEVIYGKKTAADTLKGPAIPGAKVEEAGATLTTSDGVSLSYTNVAGTIQITAGPPNASVIPITQTKLCLPTKPGQPVTFSNAQGNWTCETITFATEQCDIKTAGTDPCRFIGGSCISY